MNDYLDYELDHVVCIILKHIKPIQIGAISCILCGENPFNFGADLLN